MGSPEVEILVHITAPSKTSDDIRYRALAAAYIEFEPVGRVNIESGQELPSSQPRPSQPMPTSLVALDSPDISFGSVLDNASSPAVTRRIFLPAEEASVAEPASQSSWLPPPSVVPDSYPDNNISLAKYCSPTRSLEHYLWGLRGPGSPLTGSESKRQASPRLSDSTDMISESPVGEQFEQNSERSSQPYARSLTAQIGTKVLPEADIQTSSAFSQDAASQAVTDSARPAASPRADSERPPRKRQRVVTELGLHGLPRSSSDIGPRPSSGPRSVEALETKRVRRTITDLEIRSPNPPVSEDDLEPSALVTEMLAKLTRDLDIGRRFRPREQVRELRPFERGFWLLNCTAWGEVLREEAWTFLLNYVGRGSAGWGVWCRRSDDRSTIRLYCFGHLVGHMYLVLYLASRRKILYSGGSWFGADGTAVIVMGAKRRATTYG